MDNNSDNRGNVVVAEERGGSLRQRLMRVKRTRWIRFAIVAALFIAWVIWLGSWWVILFLPLLADIYLTGYIPWTWWKRCKNPVVRYVMGWVDAIIYALVLVYFIFIYVLIQLGIKFSFHYINVIIVGIRLKITFYKIFIIIYIIN